MYTFPDGVRTRQDGSKSCVKSAGGADANLPLRRLIVGFLGGTSGGRGALSRRQPAINKFTIETIETRRKSVSILMSF